MSDIGRILGGGHCYGMKDTGSAGCMMGVAKQIVGIHDTNDMVGRQVTSTPDQYNNIKHVILAQQYVGMNARLGHYSALIMVVLCDCLAERKK